MTRAEYLKKWRSANPEKVRAYRKEQYRRHQESERNGIAIYYRENSTALRERRKNRYRTTTRDRELKANKHWCKSNSEKRRLAMTSRTQNGAVAFGHEDSISLFHRLAARFTKIRPSLKSVLQWSDEDKFLTSVWLKHDAQPKAGVSVWHCKRPGFLRRYR